MRSLPLVPLLLSLAACATTPQPGTVTLNGTALYRERIALPRGVHFTLIEGVADHIAETLFTGDPRVQRVQIEIVKLAIAEADEKIGITLVRHRR